MEPLAQYLAQEARRWGLESADLENSYPDAVQAFAQAVLTELAALGLIQDGEKEVGCWATSRSRGH